MGNPTLSVSDPGIRLVVTAIKAHLEEKRLTCADVARAAGVHYTVMLRALNGVRGLSLTTFRKLYAAYSWMRPILEIAVFMPEKAEEILQRDADAASP